MNNKKKSTITQDKVVTWGGNLLLILRTVLIVGPGAYSRLCSIMDPSVRNSVGVSLNVKDWTLEEVKECCSKHGTCVSDCPFSTKNKLCRMTSNPCDWDLTDKPRWTQQEVEFARLFNAACKNVVWIQRNDEKTLVWVVEHSNEEYRLPFRLFPSIQPGQSYTLDEIIGGAQ